MWKKRRREKNGVFSVKRFKRYKGKELIESEDNKEKYTYKTGSQYISWHVLATSSSDSPFVLQYI